jgi:parallel beta-helix repeat protein
VGKKENLNIDVETPIETLARREFLRTSLLLAVPAILGNLITPRTAKAGAFALPTRGSTYINVKNKGASGNGIHDDTVAIQNAINSLPSSGGTVYLPSGKYLIDGVKTLRLKSNMLFQMATGASLIIKPTSSGRHYALSMMNVSNIEINGGLILGERDKHTGTDGEWGYGIQVGGKSVDGTISGPANRIFIRNIHIAKCWGDGICVGSGSKDVEIRNVLCTQNRRQGLSITKSSNIRVFDSEFSYTKGTSPECGIDIEPDLPSENSDILIQNCLLRGNNKYGINIFSNSSRVTVRGCTVEDNASCGIVTVGTSAVYLAENTIQNNSATGLLVEKSTTDLQVSQNTFYNNYKRLGDINRVNFSQVGMSSKISRDILIQKGASNIRITTNYYL